MRVRAYDSGSRGILCRKAEFSLISNVRRGQKNMKTLSASVEITVPRELVYSYVKNSVSDPRFLEAYASLRAPTQFSGKLVLDEPFSTLTIDMSNIDSITGRRGRLGWQIQYNFDNTDNGKTFITVSITYGLLMAIAGFTTVEGQAQNEILSRIHALLALEGAPRLE